MRRAGRTLCGMGRTEKHAARRPARTQRVLPDLNPWREVGWIFRDGELRRH